MAITLHVDRLWESPFVFSVFVTLKEKNIAFETVELDLDQQATQDSAYRDRSITAKVPALVHDGFWLAESLAIVEYLEEEFGAPVYERVLPIDARERARARQVLSFLRTDLFKLREERSTYTVFYERAKNPLGPEAQAAADKLFSVAERLLPEGAQTLASSWSIADADLAMMLSRLVVNGDPVPPRLRAYFDAQWSRPSVRAFVEHPRPK